MKNKIINKLPENVKTIKVLGQGCLDDCENLLSVSGNMRPIAGGMVPCYEKVCTYTYGKPTASITKWF